MTAANSVVRWSPRGHAAPSFGGDSTRSPALLHAGLALIRSCRGRSTRARFSTGPATAACSARRTPSAGVVPGLGVPRHIRVDRPGLLPRAGGDRDRAMQPVPGAESGWFAARSRPPPPGHRGWALPHLSRGTHTMRHTVRRTDSHSAAALVVALVFAGQRGTHSHIAADICGGRAPLSLGDSRLRPRGPRAISDHAAQPQTCAPALRTSSGSSL
jgi:hypothetical protein